MRSRVEIVLKVRFSLKISLRSVVWQLSSRSVVSNAPQSKMIVIIVTVVTFVSVVLLLLMRLREWRSKYYGYRRLPVADQDLEEGAAAGWSEEEMAADSSSVASYEASHNTFNSSPSTTVPDSMAAAVQRDGELTSTPQSQRSSDLDQGYNSRQSSPSSSPRHCHCRQCAKHEKMLKLQEEILIIKDRRIKDLEKRKKDLEDIIEIRGNIIEIKENMIEVLEQAYEGARRLSVTDQDLEEGAAAGWSEEEMAADSSSVASYEASNNTFNSSPSTTVPNAWAAAVQRDGVMTSTPLSQRGSDQDQGYDSRPSSPSSSPRHSRYCADVEIEALSESFRNLQIE